jgi:hypothetical protein
MAWVESLVPMGIICLSIASIGFLEGVVHRGFHYGRNKRVGTDDWDRNMDSRDESLIEASRRK